MYLSREEYLSQQAQKAQKQQANQTRSNLPGFFKLKNDGDETIVRFVYTDPDQLQPIVVHPVTIDGKFKRINCLRESFKDSVDKCPLCKAGIQTQQRLYVKLIEYTRNEDGSINHAAKVWDCSASYVNILNNLFAEYGNLSDCVFKVKRSGTGLQTKYSIMYANPSIYNADLYPKDFTQFENFDLLGTAVLDYSKDQMNEFLETQNTSVSTETKSTMTTEEVKDFWGMNDNSTTTATPRRVTY